VTVKIVIDALCAEFGGIRTYADHLLEGWAREFPDDDVHVAVRRGSTITATGLQRHELCVARPDSVGRPWAQTTSFHALVGRLRPDCVLATAPTTDVRRSPAPLGIVVHDLRTELRPEQFSTARRLLRSVSYGRSYRLASGFICVSRRTLHDLRHRYPGVHATPATVVHHGGDHVRAWASPSRCGPAVAFAHHTNKNPELVLQSWAELRRRGARVPGLALVGAPAPLRVHLSRVAARLGLEDGVSISGFLAEEAFKRVFCEASVVVFPSDFEGFGLPVLEAMALRKPVVISPDPGLLEVAAGHAVEMHDWSAGALANAIDRALIRSEGCLDEAKTWASRFTWAATIRSTRAALVAFTEHRRCLPPDHSLEDRSCSPHPSS
jgi:glycosyltransferase involved in cell wall biosynthesis